MSDGLSIPDARELAEGLSALGPKTANKLGDAGLHAWAKPIVAEAKRLVRRRTGGLARSITDRKAKGATGHTVSRVIGFRRPSGSHAHFIEFGTVHSPAYPFMRPALDTMAQQGLDEMGRSIGTGIDSETAKLLKG